MEEFNIVWVLLWGSQPGLSVKVMSSLWGRTSVCSGQVMLILNGLNTKLEKLTLNLLMCILEYLQKLISNNNVGLIRNLKMKSYNWQNMYFNAFHSFQHGSLLWLNEVVVDNLYLTCKPCSWSYNLFNSLGSFYMI